ncbi:Clan CA, family C19, ubiquitin hydrolase-like cysteine peptidase [Trichomonas vaginalis G3]|uniref:Ubiquitin carboxyl-terminal hydrolase n=1 Tax=Trichomonas vaginalis (strain ATCC PRA-98 / G3) TaxID=412133 RepID=A2FB68_TRIV3|nr:ubiquitinyl hydrolase protein [Trichomonas vaginalis G3]EAX97849.1 Clan CA, family C19, ubiquitin hydrolase-like cysteine peptidase [Trichomonas vaginalis G3]KAI5541790.1 ubiquitinyl hydrolase protein [Trichomonas vaginalis G3]|eukprot:XP_001310779.1 Clan CA, family C19, ubiquitin hydrolase-like cysteine peptidase [Trichomonas vaginalis G3]
MDNAQSLKAHDEKEIIKAFEEQYKLVPENRGYIISATFVREWKKYVDFSEKKTTGPRPATIDNRKLLNENNELRKNAIINLEFEVITQQVWETFHSWYGGGPEITVEIAHDPIRNKNVPVLKYSTYKLCYGSQLKTIVISKYSRVSDLYTKSLELFGFSPNDYHLRNYEGRIPGEILDQTKIICEYMLKDNQELLIEENAPDPTKTEFYSTKACSVADIQEEVMPDTKDIHSLQPLNKRAISLVSIDMIDRPQPGTAGFLNLGNTCYMNSTLQCLFHTPPLLHLFEGNEWTNYPNNGALLSDFVELCKIAWNGNQSVINPHAFKDVIDRIAPEFRGRDPHDAHEFLGTVLRTIHDDMNIAKGRPQSIKMTRDPMQAWNAMKLTDDSPIIDIFFGMCRHTLTCPKCNNKQSSFEPFMTLNLHLPPRKVITIQIIFVPANPVEPMRTMKLKVFEDASLEEYEESISLEVKRKIYISFADIQESSHRAIFIPTYKAPAQGHEIYAFEISSHYTLHVVVWLCVKIKKPYQKNMMKMGMPYIISISNENATTMELLRQCDNFFSYLWEGQQEKLPPDLQDLKDKLMSFGKPCNTRFKIKLEKKLFSKSTTFKPFDGVPWVSKRNVYAILNPQFLIDGQFNWSMIRRQLRQTATMPSNRTCSPINRCFDTFSMEETLDEKNLWYCSECHSNVAAKSQTLIWKLPKVLIIQLKRFYQEGMRLLKNNTFVKYPIILDMNPHFGGPGTGGKYRLYGVMEHQGSLTGGHYEASCFVEGINQWYHYSDASAKEITDQQVISSNAYLLFYQRIE